MDKLQEHLGTFASWLQILLLLLPKPGLDQPSSQREIKDQMLHQVPGPLQTRAWDRAALEDKATPGSW